MKNRTLIWAAAVTLAIANFWTASSSLAQTPAVAAVQLSHDEMEQFLKTAKVVNHRGLSMGITNSRRATLTDGRITHDAHIQMIDESKQRFEGTQGVEMNFRDCYKFNIAGHLLDRLLDLNMVPCSVERKFGGQSAAFTWWVDNVQMTELDRTKKKLDPPDKDIWNKEMYAVRVFDQLIFNTDRNLGNLVITNDWRIWMIDHTRAFRMYHQLRQPKDLVRCDRKLLDKLRQLDREILEKELQPYLTRSEVQGIFARAQAIVTFFDRQVASKGEMSVLYDLPVR